MKYKLLGINESKLNVIVITVFHFIDVIINVRVIAKYTPKLFTIFLFNMHKLSTTIYTFIRTLDS